MGVIRHEKVGRRSEQSRMTILSVAISNALKQKFQRAREYAARNLD